MAQYVPQSMVQKTGSNPCIVWDGSTKIEPDGVVMNDNIPLELEAHTTFGRSKKQYSANNTTMGPPLQEQALILPTQTWSAQKYIPEFLIGFQNFFAELYWTLEVEISIKFHYFGSKNSAL